MITTVSRRSAVYIGNGTTTAFSFPFRVFNPSEVSVVVREVGQAVAAPLGSNLYTVSLNDNAGGTVTLKSPLATGAKLVVLSAIPYTQELGLINQGAFNPDDLNRAWDKNCALIQQVLEKATRAITIDPLYDGTPESLLQDIFSTKDQAAQSALSAAQSAANAAQSAEKATVVHGMRNELQTLITNMPSIKTDAQNIESIKTTAANIQQVGAVASVAPAVGVVSGSIGSVQTVATNIDAVNRASTLTDVKKEIVIAADNAGYFRESVQNIVPIREVAEHSNAVQIVAAEFNAAIPHPELHDFGFFNVDDVPSYTPTGGAIANVSAGINDVKTVATNIADVSQASHIVEFRGDVLTVASNIHHVKTDSMNIAAIIEASKHSQAIQTIAADFSKTVDCPNFHDFGYFGTDDVPGYVPTGGAISAVGGSIADVKVVAANIEHVKNAAGVVTDLNASIKRVEAAAATVQANQQGALNAATTATAKATAAEQAAAAAKASETSASASATSASGSASTATTKASEASSSASAARASETAAAGSAASAAADAKRAQDAAAQVGSPLAKPQNLADLPDKAVARTNLGLGSMAQANIDFGTWSA